jgi:hypothetical protein
MKLLMDLSHQDPVDRFLGATALVYHLTLVTADEGLIRSKKISILPIRTPLMGICFLPSSRARSGIQSI